MENKPLIIIAIVIAAVGGAAAYFLLNPFTEPAKMPEEEPAKFIPPVEHIEERTGRMMEVLHDDSIMIYVNGYTIKDTIDASVRVESMGNQFLTVDLTFMNMGEHIQTLSPNLFKLRTSSGELLSSIYTSSVDAGLRKVNLLGGQSIRTFIVFEAAGFGNTPPILSYSDLTSAFRITLLRSDSPGSPLPSELKIRYRTGELMHDGTMQLTANAAFISEAGEYAPEPDNMFVKISMSIKNTGESLIHIDPSYVFILDEKSYLYGIHESTSALPSALKMVDLEPSSSISGDVVVELPKDSTNLVFMYAGSSNSFLARIS